MIAKTHTVCLGGATLNIDVLETLDFSSEDLDISLWEVQLEKVLDLSRVIRLV